MGFPYFDVFWKFWKNNFFSWQKITYFAGQIDKLSPIQEFED